MRSRYVVRVSDLVVKAGQRKTLSGDATVAGWVEVAGTLEVEGDLT